MATRHRIDEALTSQRMGDVEKYFQSLTTMIDANSGLHDFKLLTTDCSNVNAPFKADQFTTFKLTDPSMDIIDMSKGFIQMKCDIDINFLFKTLPENESTIREYIAFFIGFKSGAHIINNYNVFSNGRMTACKNTKSRYEQMITYSCKSKEERAGRPGMYSPHEKVREMDECVCGTYVFLPPAVDRNTTQTVSFDVIIQIDDLLPFSAMSYFPRFINKELELQLSCNLLQNMVFCQVPIRSVCERTKSKVPGTNVGLNRMLLATTMEMDGRFTQCGDYAKCYYDLNTTDNLDVYHDITIIPSNLNVLEAKSYIYGFNIKDVTKQNIIKTFAENNFVIPAQWIEHYTFSQLPTGRNITTNIQVPMFNCCQVIMTFPNSGNQLTVSRNPHLESVQCHISDRVIPDKYFKTLDKVHSEMTLANLSLDSLFTAPDELIEALTKDRKEYGTWTLKKVDDSDYMLVFNLERWGNGCFCDGLTGNPIPINLNANYMYSDNNPHYYVDDNGTKKHTAQNVNLFIVQDAFWVFGPEGGEFVKDSY